MKPDDVSQEAWAATCEINLILPYSYVQGQIARAIDAAKAEQREADAKIAEGFIATEALFPFSEDSTANHAAAVGQEYAADEIAAAIRGTPQ